MLDSFEIFVFLSKSADEEFVCCCGLINLYFCWLVWSYKNEEAHETHIPKPDTEQYEVSLNIKENVRENKT